jgi:uncharacterized protein
VTKIVVDTNISISALLWGGTPQRLFTVAVDHSIPLLTSSPLIQELEKTLNKPKLAKYVLLTGKTPSELVSDVARIMTLVEPAEARSDAVRDPMMSKYWQQRLAAKRLTLYPATMTC